MPEPAYWPCVPVDGTLAANPATWGAAAIWNELCFQATIDKCDFGHTKSLHSFQLFNKIPRTDSREEPLFLPAAIAAPLPQLFGFFALALTLFIILLYPWWGDAKRCPWRMAFFVTTCAWLVLHKNMLSALALLWVASPAPVGSTGQIIVAGGL